VSIAVSNVEGVRWNPGDYAANSESQHAWARDLIATLRLNGRERLLDVGCGDGKITAELARAVPGGQVLGIDSSAEMIEFARRNFPTASHPNLAFQVMDARAIQADTGFNVVFSNAALHWIDDHPAFLRGASSCLVTGGRLVVSCGGAGNAQAVFDALRSVIRRTPWKECFRRLKRPYHFYSPDDYATWLPRHGFSSNHVRLARKDMTFAHADKFAGWIRTTWLPYTQRVPAADREAFVASVVERYLQAHPPDSAGAIHVEMVRLEIDAVKV
jgi:trans-aconitate 2-methyltransferase